MFAARSALVLSLSLAVSSGASAGSSEEAAAEAARAYQLEVTPGPVKVKAGAQGTAKVTVVPRPNAHVDPRAPLSLTAASASDGKIAEVSRAKQVNKDAKPTEKQGVEFELAFTGKAPGADALKAQVSFYICTANLCERQKRDVTVPVVVE